jgi:hypothetical protein
MHCFCQGRERLLEMTGEVGWLSSTLIIQLVASDCFGVCSLRKEKTVSAQRHKDPCRSAVDDIFLSPYPWKLKQVEKTPTCHKSPKLFLWFSSSRVRKIRSVRFDSDAAGPGKTCASTKSIEELSYAREARSYLDSSHHNLFVHDDYWPERHYV